jgi:hypothetical protein
MSTEHNASGVVCGEEVRRETADNGKRGREQNGSVAVCVERR